MDGKNTKIIVAIAIAAIVVIAAVGICLIVNNNNGGKDNPPAPPVPPVTKNAYVILGEYKVSGKVAPQIYITDANGKDQLIVDPFICSLSDKGTTKIFTKDTGWTWDSQDGVFKNTTLSLSLKMTVDNDGKLNAVPGDHVEYTFSYEKGLKYSLSIEITRLA